MRNYNISVEETTKETLPQYDSSEECYQIAIEEYRHVTERANKFDNKVNIMITFCSIFFAFIIDLLEDIVKTQMPVNTKQTIMLILYIILFILIGVGYVISMFILILCLKPLEMKRFDPSLLLEKSLWNKPAAVSYMVATKRYCEFIIQNNSLLEKGYGKLKYVSVIMAFVVILSFVLKILLVFKAF